MGRYRKQDRELKETFNEIKESSRATAENTKQMSENLADIKGDTEKISKSKISLYSLIVAIIALVVAFSGVTAVGIYDRWKAKSEPKAEAVAAPEVGAEEKPVAEEPEYEIYLYSEYSTIKAYVETDITATLNFETDAVTITAYYESGGEDTIPLNRKNTTEWQKRVYFDKLGVHQIVVTATAPDGEIIENSIDIEVIPISF